MPSRDFAPLFLLYVSRSGSTFLGENIATRLGDVCVMPEADLLKPLLVQGAAEIARTAPEQWAAWLLEDPRAASMGLGAAELAEAFRNDGCGSIAGIVRSVCRLYRARTRPGARHVLIKKGSNIRFLDRIPRLFPDAAYLLIYRDPRAIVRSQVTQARLHHPGRMGRGDPAHIARGWAGYMRRFEALTAAGHRTFEVRYEDLVADVPAVIGQLADWLEIGAAPRAGDGGGIPLSAAEAADLHRRVKGPADTSRIDAWRRDLAAGTVFVIEDICAGAMQARGYALEELPRTGALRAGLLRARARLASLRCALGHHLRRSFGVLRRNGIRRFLQMARLRMTQRLTEKNSHASYRRTGTDSR